MTFTASEPRVAGQLEETFADDYALWPALMELTTCLCAEVANAGLPELCFCGLVPGDTVAWDYIGDTGQGMAWVRLMNIYPSAAFPAVDSTLRSSCASPLAAQVEMGILRCAPSPDSDGTPPSMAAQWEATRLQLADMAAMYAAVRCCYDRQENMVLGQYNPAGPEGGVVGGTWQVWLGGWPKARSAPDAVTPGPPSRRVPGRRVNPRG